MRYNRSYLCLLVILFLIGWTKIAASAPVASQASATQEAPKRESSGGMISVGDFLPAGYVTDGSVSYQAELQRAIDAAASSGHTLVFLPIVYLLDERGLQLRSHLTLCLEGAIFRLSEDCQEDGQAFLGNHVTNVQFLGGEIAGRNDVWPKGINIRGIKITGKSSKIRVRDTHMHHLSSNGIGVFGTPDHLIRDVWVSDAIIEDSCSYYGDYLTKDGGPEKGSVREDQGLVAFYFVQDFVVRGCRLEKSRSDGTHFYRCRHGHFVHNRVYAAQMGGYFVETSEDILAADNVIRDNGSRGVTIERGSRNCILNGNVIANSGREGLWAPQCTGLVVSGNVFDRNGRKVNGPKPRLVWNANITVNEAGYDPTNSKTADYIITDNILYTTASQIAAMRIDADKVSGIVVRDNLLRDENRRILIEGENQDSVLLSNNN